MVILSQLIDLSQLTLYISYPIEEYTRLNMIKRNLLKDIIELLEHFPCVGILGPRQCGKSTMTKTLLTKDVIYLDLENRQDVSKLGDPLLFFENNSDKLIILDEVQFMPDIFIDIKSYIDQSSRNGQFLLLGSASEVFLNQSSESMAGRIVYQELSGFLWCEVESTIGYNEYLFRGVMPRSVLAPSDKLAQIWTNSYINTFFQRDLLQLSPGITQQQVRRLFVMLAHLHGQELNYAKLSKSLSISYNTVKSYVDILLGAYQLFALLPYSKNTGKRLIKSPKIYLSDNGSLHTLLNIKNLNQLLGHPIFGFSFEGMIIYNIIKRYPDYDFSFYKTSAGAELDLVIEGNGKTIGVEIKSSTSPKVTRGFWNALEDIKADIGWVVGWVDHKAQLRENVFISGLQGLTDYMDN